MNEKINNILIHINRIVVILFGVLLLICGGVNIFHNIKDKYHHSYTVYQQKNELELQSIKKDLVCEVDSYILAIAPTSNLNGLVIVDKCMEYNIDICFVLSQGQVESTFGTRGLATKTNSVFNVYAFDGLNHKQISKQGKYTHPDYSVEPYLKLLTNDYLVNGKTEKDLFHKYVNKDGKRYASATDYENKLYNVYENILRETKIPELSKNYKKYKILVEQ